MSSTTGAYMTILTGASALLGVAGIILMFLATPLVGFPTGTLGIWMAGIGVGGLTVGLVALVCAILRDTLIDLGWWS